MSSGTQLLNVDSIVFVHGLKGHALHTWEKRGFMWPKHLLGAKYPTARIITYGYDADIVKLFGRVEKGTIFDRSKAMIQAIHRIRRDHYQRPLLFVAHSLGGILVKDGLCWAKAQAGFSAVKVNEVYSATKGVIFLGTPHRGASGQYATVGEQLRRLVKIAGQESDPYLLAGLKSDSEGLTRISESFHLLADDKTFLIFSFVESKPLSAVKGMGFVVDRNSGYMGLAREAQDEIPDADHREMARFSSKDEEGYKKVEDAVGHCIDFATEKADDDDWVSVPEVAKNTGSYELIYEFTANSQHKSDIQILRSGRLDGTCEWISEQVAFQNWINGSIKLLLLVGAAGAGKSHVFAKVIDLLNERYQKPCRGDTTTPLSAYYFCRTPTKKKTLTNGLKSMIGQLAYLDEAFANELSVRWDRHRSYDGETAPTIAWLWQNLLTGSKALTKRTSVYLVVDGLDECDEAERRDFLESAYLHCAKGTGPVIQVFCSGRPEVKTDMSQIMDSHMHNLDVPTIEVSWQTKSDIELLIEKKMTRVKFKDKALRTKVTEAVANDANGSFLWTDLTLKEFINAKSTVEVDSALGRMRANATLDDMYQGIMDTLIKGASEIQVQTFKSILTWLIYGSDIMRYAMLEEAVEKAVGTKIFALSDEIERFGSVMELGSFQRLRLPSAGLEAAGTGAAWAGPHSNTFARSLVEDSDEEEGDEDIFNDDGTGITGDEEVRIRHATFQKWYADVLDHDSPIYSSPNDAHIDLLRVCLETLVQYRISADEHPRLLAHARDAWVEHFMRVDWQDVEKDALWPIARDLRTLFTDWPTTRAWLGDASFLKWMEQRTRLETALEGFLRRTSTLETGGTVVQAWAQGLFISPLPPLEALADATLRTAEAGGFFTHFPAIGSDNMDTSLIMRGLLFIYEIAVGAHINPRLHLEYEADNVRAGH
jgi:protein SERAC1